MIFTFFKIGLMANLVIAQTWTRWPTDTYVPGVCICVPADQCAIASGGGNSDGRGNLDPRIATSGGMPAIITGTINDTCQPVSVGTQIMVTNQTSCANELVLCCPSPGYTCGLRYPPVPSASDPVSGSGQAEYGSHPWIIAIYDLTFIYVGTGVLISQQHALTVAHKLYNQTSPVIARAGEYDTSGRRLPFPRVDINAGFVMHPNFNLRNLRNNIAVMFLERPAPFGMYPTITNLCIPNVTLSGIRCFVAGWGQDFFVGGSMQKIMREIDLPIINHQPCEEMLRNNTILGNLFRLDQTSFVCAGGEAGKDACTGDGGSPLSCYVYDRWYLFGLTAWGMGCGQANIPGVYVNVQSYVGWIQQTIQQGLSRRTNTTTASPSSRSEGNVTSPTIRANQTSSAAATTAASTISTATTTRPRAAKFTKGTTTKKTRTTKPAKGTRTRKTTKSSTTTISAVETTETEAQMTS